MSCKSCQSRSQRNLNGDIAIHFPGLKGLDKPIVWVFPKLLVCLNCGFTEFALPEKELGVLVHSEGGCNSLVERERRRKMEVAKSKDCTWVLPPRY
jgi:hypothetical protein